MNVKDLEENLRRECSHKSGDEDVYLLVFQQLAPDGEVPASAQSLAAGPQVAQQAGPLHPPVEGRHVQSSQVVFEELLQVCRDRFCAVRRNRRGEGANAAGSSGELTFGIVQLRLAHLLDLFEQLWSGEALGDSRSQEHGARREAEQGGSCGPRLLLLFGHQAGPVHVDHVQRTYGDEGGAA